jgi:capsular exopolysaccharide synthesis family protein
MLSTEVVATAGPIQAVPAAPVIDADVVDAAPRHLRDYLWILHKYRWLAAACFGLVAGLAVLVTLLTPRLYVASTRLQMARQSPIQLRLEENVLRVDENDRNVNGSSSFLATQVAVLRSRDLAERVIRSQRLADNEAFLHPGPERQGLLEVGGSLVSLLRPRGWEAGTPTDAEGPVATRVDPILLDRYMRWLSVQDVRGTDLVEVSFTTPSPSLSAFLAAAHTQAFMEANEEARRSTDVTAKEFLARQIRQSEEQVERAESALEGFAVEHPDVAVNQEQKTVAQRIGEVSSLLTKAEGNRVALQSRYEFLTGPTAEPKAYFQDKAGVQKLHLALLDLRAQRAALATRLGPNHTQMLDLGHQEDEVARQLDAEVGQEVAAVRTHFAAARQREVELEKKLGQLESAAIGAHELGTRYELLKGDVETSRSLRESLLKQQMETAVNSELAATNMRVVERAEVPRRPSQPNVPLNLALGLIGGTVLALGAAFVCDYFDNSVKSSDEVEELLQLPTLATIPNFALARRGAARVTGAAHLQAEPGNERARDLVVLNEPWSPVAEAFRSLRTAVLFSTPDAPPKVILVTSARASEGKTVNSVNLATTLAEAGSRVLLIDVDLRHPGCHRALGVENDRGLSSFLAGQVELHDVIHALEAPRLFFIPAGPLPPNPAELVGSARMRTTLERLQESYDFIILDTPPVLPVTDAIVLSREADGVVLVVKGHDTPRDLVRRARDQLAQSGAHLLGAVVNNVDLGWGDLYFYGRYYGYAASAPPAGDRAA